MSTYNCSLAFEEIREPGANHLVDLLPMQHLSISNAPTDLKPATQVIKVSGNITVSF